MNTIPVSVFIITYNEQNHIARVLQSCTAFDEVIAVDSGSSDQTVSIAESLGAKVVHNPWQGYAKQKDFAMQQCRNSWVLNLDADEELTSELIEDIKRTIESDADYMRCYRDDQFIGKFFPDYIHKPNNHRLFKKTAAQYRLNDLVHEGPDFTGKEARSAHTFKHYGYANIETLSSKYNHYSTLKADERFAKKKQSSLLKLILIRPIIFLKVYFFQRYFLAGRRGYIYASLQAQYAFLKEAKLYELHAQDSEKQ